MSYDLYLSSPRLNDAAFSRYFEGRRNYQSLGVYGNEDTGVYFSFDWEEPSLTGTPRIAFNMNYFRPHIFGLEAEPELAAFVKTFDCAIEDPQLSGMANGPYSREGFLRGWNTGNLFAYQTIGGKSSPFSSLVVDDHWIESVWRWNFGKDHAQISFVKEHFLPKINWAKQIDCGETVAYCIWGEGIPTAFPDCASHVLVARHKDRVNPASVLEVKLLAVAEVAEFPGCEWCDTQVGRLLYAPATLPPSQEVLNLFDGSFSTFETLLNSVAVDNVLDKSLMAQVSLAK